MIKSKQRMDFNMTSNNQRNIPPKKTDSEPSKATESKSAKTPGAASPKKADAQSSTKSHRRRAYLDDFRKTQNCGRKGENSAAIRKRVEKEIYRDGGSRNRSPPADDHRRLRTVGGTAGKCFRAASICSAAGGSLQPRVGMCKALGQGISASGIRLSADSVQNFAARRNLHCGSRSVRYRRTCRINASQRQNIILHSVPSNRSSYGRCHT